MAEGITLICAYCKIDPGTKPGSMVWQGFRDGDTNQYVCYRCKGRHYHEKELQNIKTYTEFPVVVKEKSA